jgi:hypothetical protein
MSQTVKPKVSITEDSEGFIAYDCTGTHSSSNTGGFGIKNPAIGDFDKATLLATTPDGLTTYEINMTGDMPRTDGVGYLVRSFMVGGVVIPGVWTFQYILEIGGKQYKSAKTQKLLSRLAECCVEKLRNKVDIKLLLQGDEYQRKIALLSAAMEMTKIAGDCGRFKEAQKSIETIYAQCKCDCCF